MTSNRFVLASEAARILELSPQRVRQLVDQGRLAARRGPRGMRLIERKAVMALSEQRRQTEAAKPRSYKQRPEPPLVSPSLRDLQRQQRRPSRTNPRSNHEPA